jgi:hypothetical protein
MDSLTIIGNVTVTNEWAEGVSFSATVDRALAARIIKAALAVREHGAYSMELWDGFEVFTSRWMKCREEEFATFADTSSWPICLADIPPAIADKLRRLKHLTDAENDVDEEDNEVHLPRTEEAKALREDPEVAEYLNNYEIHYDEDLTAETFNNESGELEPVSTSCDCIVVLEDGFHWSAYEKHSPGLYETDRCSFEMLEPLLDAPLPEILKSKPPTVL